MIAIADLQFQFPHSDFQLAVSALDVADGERMAIVGPSGSGKTTLLHLIAGILLPERGTIHMQGQPVNTLGDAARRELRVTRIGLVFQSFELVSYLDVFENILLPYRLNPALRLTSGVSRRVEQLAAETGLTHRPGISRIDFHRARNNGSPSVGRCCPSRRCCWPTNRPVISIRWRNNMSWTCFSNRLGARARRC